jgi:hypothetical protein
VAHEQAKAAAVKKNLERVKKKQPALPIDPKLGQVRANRAKALFSHIWNYAREQGRPTRQTLARAFPASRRTAATCVWTTRCSPD